MQPVLASPGNDEIRVAVRAHAGEQQAIKKWGPTIDYLNQTLPQYRFVMLPYINIKQQLVDAKAQRFHFFLTNPSTYVELEVNAGASAMLTLINNRRDTAQTRFGSVIFTHVGQADILDIRDLKGKNFLAVSPLGFGGWRVGLKVLKDHGIDPVTDFASLKFTGNQYAVVKAIINKKAHAGMVRTDMLERLADKGEINLRNIRILNQQSTPNFPFFHSTQLYPEWPFAVMPHTSKELAEQVKQALLKLNASFPAAKAGKYVGWALALDYRPVKNLLQDIGVSPFSKEKPALLIFFVLLGLGTLFIAFYIFKRYSDNRAG